MSGTLLATLLQWGAMRAAALAVIFLVALAVVHGCSSNEMADGCYSDSDCGSGFLCDEPTGACYAPSDGGTDSCTAPSDCPASYTCGKDGRCSPGDCFFHGCVSGFECQSSTGTWQCLPGSAGAGGASGDEDDTQAGTGGVAGAAAERG